MHGYTNRTLGLSRTVFYPSFMDTPRDLPGPLHEPRVYAGIINGVVVAQSPFVNYLEDNTLTELYRPEWPGVFAAGEPIEHLYTIDAPSGGNRSEWYFHEHSLDRYMLVNGALNVGLYDGRCDSPTYGLFEVVSLEQPGGSNPNALRIPPLVWHSLRWKSPKGILLNAKLPGYSRGLPDKFRIQLDDLPETIDRSF